MFNALLAVLSSLKGSSNPSLIIEVNQEKVRAFEPTPGVECDVLVAGNIERDGTFWLKLNQPVAHRNLVSQLGAQAR